MSHRHIIWDQNKTHFITLTIERWIDIFTRQVYKDIVIDSLNYCILNKGLIVHAYVIMSNHIHMMVTVKEGNHLSDVLRDFKRHTSKQITETMNSVPESRREWFNLLFGYAGKDKKQDYAIWQSDNHPEIVETEQKMSQVIRYIHMNPVRAGYVDYPEEYVYSSARNYLNKPGKLAVEVVVAYGTY